MTSFFIFPILILYQISILYAILRDTTSQQNVASCKNEYTKFEETSL